MLGLLCLLWHCWKSHLSTCEKRWHLSVCAWKYERVFDAVFACWEVFFTLRKHLPTLRLKKLILFQGHAVHRVHGARSVPCTDSAQSDTAPMSIKHKHVDWKCMAGIFYTFFLSDYITWFSLSCHHGNQGSTISMMQDRITESIHENGIYSVICLRIGTFLMNESKVGLYL